MQFITESGVEVNISPADFLNSLKLKNAVLRAIKESGVDVSTIDLDKLSLSSLQPILEIVLSADTDEAVEKAIFHCLGKCTYGGERIVRDTFEPIEARKDYYDIIIACLKENLTPFFESPILKLKKLTKKQSVNQN